jgi:hypothetical protein
MKLFISFSGGKTSAYMTKWLLDNKRGDYSDIVILFANTGQENEETLRFVDRCDKEWGLGVVWVEAVVNPEKGQGTRHRVVNYETASRIGEPFEDVIKKYGIPNQVGMFCTRELKLAPMTSYLRELGWKKGDYQTAIGIRFDEMDRVSANMEKNNIIYPLVEDIKTTKEMINDYWRNQSFTLNLREHQGNCSWCYKKSLRKLLTLAQDTPDIFDFPIRMERLYGKNGQHSLSESRVFFRERRSGLDILEQSKKPFRRWKESRESMDMFGFEMEMDSANGCSESCEVY